MKRTSSLVDAVSTKTLAGVAALSLLCLFLIFSPALPYMTIHAQQLGPGGVPGARSSTSVTNTDGSLTISPTSGAVVASLNTGHAVTWTTSQTIDGNLVLQAANSWTLNPSGGGNTFFFEDNLFPGETFPLVLNYGVQGIEVPGNGCYGFSGGNVGDEAPVSFLCQTATDVFTLGSAQNDTTGWLKAAAIGNGASGNTDLRGHVTLAGGSGSYTFAKTYTVAPTCVATDTTSVNAVKASATATTLTLTGTGSDVIAYLCAD